MEVRMKARTKPEVKPRGFWYERRDLLRRMYEEYCKGNIKIEVLLDAFKVDRLKPISSAYNRMYGKRPIRHDPTQLMFEWGFAGLIPNKKGAKNERQGTIKK